MKFIRLTVLVLAETGGWAAAAVGMPAYDPAGLRPRRSEIRLFPRPAKV